MKTVPTILLCTSVLAIGFAAIWALDKFKPKTSPVTPTVEPRLVTSQVVRRVRKRIDVTAHGTVTPRTEIDLIAQVAGTVTAVSPSLENGGFFAAGEMLVQIDRRDYEFEVTRAKAAVAQAKLRLSLEEAEATVAEREWKKVGEGKATPLTLRVPQVTEAKAGVASAEAVLAKAELALERTTIRAPFAGRVRRKSVDAAQFVGIGTPLARIYAIDFAEVRLPLHDGMLRYLDLPLSFGDKRSKPVAVTIRARFAQESVTWPAQIVRTEGELDAKSRMIHAIARVRDPYNRNTDAKRPPLSVGLFVEALIHGREFENVVEIPRDAVRGEGEVLVIENGRTLHRRAIRVLHRGPKSVIVDEGLEDGERICLSTIGVFAEGMPVRVSELESKPAAKGGASSR